MKKLGDIAHIRSGYTFREGMNAITKGNVLVFQAKDVAAFNELSHLPTIEFDNQRLFLQDGDVLLSVRGSLTARAVSLQGCTAIASSSVIVIRLTSGIISPDYLAMYLNSSRGQEQLQGVATGALIKTITKVELAKIPIPIPPSSTQKLLVGLNRNIHEQQQLLAHKKHLLNNVLNAASVKATKENHT